MTHSSELLFHKLSFDFDTICKLSTLPCHTFVQLVAYTFYLLLFIEEAAQGQNNDLSEKKPAGTVPTSIRVPRIPKRGSKSDGEVS